MTAADKESRAGSDDLSLQEHVALALMNSVREHHGLDPIKWDCPAISSWHRRNALRQAGDAIAAIDTFATATLPLTDPLSSGHGVGSESHPAEKLWREVGLPEYFLGNGGTNTKLYTFYNSIIERCALIAEGFDAACNSERMKLFVDAGLVIAIYKRDGEIGAAIRALQTSSPALQGSEEVLGNATLAVPISEAQRLSSEVERLRKGINDFLDDNYPNPRGYRAQGKCPHGHYYYEDCNSCDSEHFTKLLDGAQSLSAEPVASDEANKLNYPSPAPNPVRTALALARQFIDPESDPPRMTNREMVKAIDTALSAPPQSVGNPLGSGMRDVMRATLKEHWLTQVKCDHEAHTDTPICYCCERICEPKPTLGGAVDAWIDHVLAILSLPAEGEGWQAIETAPTHGEILLWWKHAGLGVGGWDEEGNGWRCEGDDRVPKTQSDCTHWMPAPAGPPGSRPPSGGGA